MGRYLARRLLQSIPVILGTLFLLHLLSVLSIQFVGDPVRALFGENAPAPGRDRPDSRPHTTSTTPV